MRTLQMSQNDLNTVLTLTLTLTIYHLYPLIQTGLRYSILQKCILLIPVTNQYINKDHPRQDLVDILVMKDSPKTRTTNGQANHIMDPMLNILMLQTTVAQA